MRIPGPTDLTSNHRAHWRTYTTADGLAGLRVEHIAQDADGHLWFGTFNDGASRFDGDRFRTFAREKGLDSDCVMALHLDREGRLWFGTLHGVFWYDGYGFHNLGEVAGAPEKGAIAIGEDREGRIWFGGQHFMGYYDGSRCRNLCDELNQCLAHPYNNSWGLVEDGEGGLWICSGHGLARYDGGRFYEYGRREGLPEAEDGPGAYAAAYSPQQGLWVGANNAVWRFDGRAFHSVDVEFPGFVRKMRADRQGRIWFCLSGAGALCHDGQGFHRFTTDNGLPYNVVNDVFEDREGLLWFATWGGGVACYDPHCVQYFEQQEDLKDLEASTLSIDNQGRIWAGFASFETRQQERITCYDGAVRNGFAVRGDGLIACQDRAGDLWVGSRKGLMRYEGGDSRRAQAATEFPASDVKTLAVDSDGGLIVGHFVDESDSCNWRISRYRPSDQTTVALVEGRSTFGAYVCALAPVPDGSLWFGIGVWGGLRDGQGIGRWHPQGGVTCYTTADGLIDDRVNDLAVDRQGNLWVATYAGVSRFDGARFQNFTTADGLPHSRVWCVCEDYEGTMWMGTDGGVARYDGRVFQALHLPHVAPASQLLPDREGTMWMATHKGVVRYRPMPFPPKVEVIQILADRVYAPDEQIEAPASASQLVFEYRGTSLRTPTHSMVYCYRLSGWDEDWQAATREHKAYYRDLPPGQYTFEVQAFDRDLNGSELASVALKVVPDPRQDRIEALEDVLNHPAARGQLIGHSKALERVLEQIALVAGTELTVLVLGKTGTGKGLVAHTVHQKSRRRKGPFIQVNCGAIPQGLVESELFGHEKGAFTGAVARKIGRFELADGGTLFLDEIGDLPLDAQQTLLQVLQDGTFQRVGSAKTTRVDVRVIAATNRDLGQAMRERAFREDLYYRLKGFELALPPLCERREDIPLLAHHFVERYAQHLNRPVPRIAQTALAYLQSYAWPGNVRELEHLVQRALLVSSNDTIEVKDFTSGLMETGGNSHGEIVDLAEFDRRALEAERSYLEQILKATNWRVGGEKGAARALGVHPEKLRSRLRKHNLQRSNTGG